MLLLLTVLMALILTIVLLAVTSILKLHFDNYSYCRNELNAKCNAEDYKYCASVRR